MVDWNFQWKWLSASNLRKEIEGFAMACQDQAITTNVMRGRIFHQLGSTKCRLCGSHDETVDHILTSCSVIAQSCYKNVTMLLQGLFTGNWQGGVDFKLHTMKWWDHHPVPVMQNNSMKLLCDFTIQTDRRLSHNRPDIMCVDFIKK